MRHHPVLWNPRSWVQRRFWLLAVAVRVAVVALPVAASGQVPQERLPERWARFDRNGDGVITREEFMGSPEVFRLLDRNDDGVLTPRELTEDVPRREDRSPREVILFRPDREDVLLQANRVYGEAEGQPLRMDVVSTSTPIGAFRPAVVFLHEGDWISGNRRMGVPRLTPLAEAGFVGISVGYRLAPDAPFPAAVNDARSAVRFLRSHAVDFGIDPDRIGVWGAGAGGVVAALLALTDGPEGTEGDGGRASPSSRVQAVCLWFTPSDLVLLAQTPGRRRFDGADSPLAQWLGAPPAEIPDRVRAASPIHFVTASSPPFLIQHGLADFTVSSDHSRRLHEALVAVGVQSELDLIPGAGHGGPGFGHPEVMERVVAFFQQALSPVE